jgi:hypothetical protein
MAVKIYNKSDNLIIDDGGLTQSYKIVDITYKYSSDVLELYSKTQPIYTDLRSNLRDFYNNSFGSSAILLEYISNFNIKEVISYNILGQSSPSATTNTTLYTVPQGKMIRNGVLTVANRSTQTTFRVALRKAGATLSNEHYIYYDVTIKANDSFERHNLKLNETDVVTIYSGSANLSFTIDGEIIDI